MAVQLNIPAIMSVLAMNKWSNKVLAERAGISRQSISTILRRGTCSAVNAGRLADALGVDVREIWKEG